MQTAPPAAAGRPRAQALRLAAPLCTAGLFFHAAFVPVSVAAMQIGLGVAAAGLACALAGGWRPSRTPLDLPLLGLAGCGLLSDALSPYGFPPLASATLWRSGLGFWIVAQALALAPEPARRAQDLVLAAAAGLSIASAVGVAQYFTAVDIVFRLGLRAEPAMVEAPGVTGHYGAMGFFTSRLTFGHNASAIVALLLGACLAGALRGGRRRAALGAAVLGLAAVLLTFDRAAWGGLVAAALCMLLALPGRVPARALRLRAAAGLGLVLALGAAAALPGVRARVASGFDLRGNADRVFLWARAREIIRDHPLLGVGFGNYPRICDRYYDRVDPGFPMRTWAHNSELSLLAETGPLGLLAGALVAAAALAALARRLREDPHGLALGGLGALVAIGVIAQVHDLLYDTKVMYALWLALAAALAPGLRQRAGAGGTTHGAPSA
jgi:O-antigen ligase